MKSTIYTSILLLLIVSGCATIVGPETISRNPYIGTIVVDYKTGRVISEDNANKLIYPASMVKLMDLMIILDKVQRKELQLTNKVVIPTEATKNIKGTIINLKEKEVFTVEDLLHALMVKSANDAAVALAIYVAGSEKAFVDLMNARARELGMKSTRFFTVNGLPHTNGKDYDISTPRDFTILGRELLMKHPEALKYTNCREYQFRKAPNPLTIKPHNYLLYSFPGCDGLKTGYNDAGGYSIITTAQQDGRRIIAVVAGCKESKTRDSTAQELMKKAFLNPAVSSRP